MLPFCISFYLTIVCICVQDCLSPLSMQALPAAPESLCIVEMGGTEAKEETGELGTAGGLFLNTGLQVGGRGVSGGTRVGACPLLWSLALLHLCMITCLFYFCWLRWCDKLSTSWEIHVVIYLFQNWSAGFYHIILSHDSTKMFLFEILQF